MLGQFLGRCRLLCDADDGAGGGGGEAPAEEVVLPGNQESFGTVGEPPPPPEPAPDSPSRPEYINEAHWDPAKAEVRVEALAKSFTDTKAALDKRKDESGVPEHANQYFTTKDDGTLFIPDGLDHLPPIDPSDVVLKAVAEAAHSVDVSTAQMEAITNAYLTGHNTHLSQYMFDPVAEAAKIHPDRKVASNIVQGVNVYVDQIEMTEGEKMVKQDIMSSADGVKFMSKVMALSGQKPIPIAVSSVPSADNDAAKKEWNELRRDTHGRQIDSGKQKRFMDLGAQLHGT